LARVYALDKQKKVALQTLEEAVELGFQDLTRLKSDEAFTAITQEPLFLKLTSGVR
jgi:hypothetical protein